MSNQHQPKQITFRDRHAKISRILVIVSSIILVVAFVLLMFALGRSLRTQDEMSRLIGLAESQGGDITVARQLLDTMRKVERFTKLPDGETPIFATIDDVTKLKSQPAFKDAINGDLILLYEKSQWVYIYRPSLDKLVSQGPFALPSPSPEPQRVPPPAMIEEREKPSELAPEPEMSSEATSEASTEAVAP